MTYFGLVILALALVELIAALIRSRMTTFDGIMNSDGCTGVPEGNWGECCFDHDRAYKEGGWFVARFKADWNMMLCIGENKNWFAAVVYFLGVRCVSMWFFRYGKKRKLIVS